MTAGQFMEDVLGAVESYEHIVVDTPFSAYSTEKAAIQERAAALDTDADQTDVVDLPNTGVHCAPGDRVSGRTVRRLRRCAGSS